LEFPAWDSSESLLAYQNIFLELLINCNFFLKPFVYYFLYSSLFNLLLYKYCKLWCISVSTISLFLSKSFSYPFSFCYPFELYLFKIDTQFCSKCFKKLSPLFFLWDIFALSSKVFAICYICREKNYIDRTFKKRYTIHKLDPNISPPPLNNKTLQLTVQTILLFEPKQNSHR
jgi:hypothetical protein